ncbi:hypothetical protein So717_17270 [Roseobacter cerasinus]|uniref:Uncharacterized protein n=2 Tax=Roseobacter cerasinus TaxID=2602289 RepID=A0A640VQU1_9RHOB|nr:hypothetical protein So717_17270 [Roseobacter cerasinus]
MNTPAASELRMERLRWLDRTEDALSAELEDVISGKSQEHSGRLVQGIGDVIVYDGLSWIRGVEETDPSSDALEYASLRAWDGELFAVIRCTAPSIAARSDRVRASYEPCRSLSVGPLDPASDLPEMTYSLPRRSLADWSEVYWKIIKLMGDWRMTRD